MSIRLLLNENVPAPSVAALRSAGIDCLAIAESHPGMDDTQVLSLAVEENRWLVTFDRDYGELLFARGHSAPPAVILLRVPTYRPDEPANWVLHMIRGETSCLGKFTVFDGQTARGRPLRHRGDEFP